MHVFKLLIQNVFPKHAKQVAEKRKIVTMLNIKLRQLGGGKDFISAQKWHMKEVNV